MKKLNFSLAALVLALVLNGCGKGSSHQSNLDNPQPASTQSGQGGAGASSAGNASQNGNGTDPNGTGSGTDKGFYDPGAPTTPPVCDSSGPAGVYEGYIKRGSGFIPLRLTLEVNKGSGTALRATLKVGLFGGADNGSTSAPFDPSINDLRVYFASGSTSGGASTPGAVTLTGILKCGELIGGKIKGTKSGEQAVVLSKFRKTFFDSRQTFNYRVTFPDGSPDSVGLLSIVTRLTPYSSNGLTDLPYYPAVTSTLQFDGIAETVIPFKSPTGNDGFLYDPLTGEIEMDTTGVGVVKCENVVLNDLGSAKKKADLEVPALVCDVYKGGDLVNHMMAVPDNTLKARKTPAFFYGKYTGESKTAIYPAMTELEYEQKDFANPPSETFPTFPLLSFKAALCTDGGNTARFVDYQLISGDPINATARFEYSKGSSGGTTEPLQIDVKYKQGFTAFTADLKLSTDTDDLTGEFLQGVTTRAKWGCGNGN